MGREIRRVPPGWMHPREYGSERHVPMFESHRDPLEMIAEWMEQEALWSSGKHPDALKHGKDPQKCPYRHWAGDPPNAADYMPNWPKDQRTHYQMYEDTTEGTPISPVFATPEEVARWCADNGASSFGHDTAGYEWWLDVARGIPPVGTFLRSTTDNSKA